MNNSLILILLFFVQTISSAQNKTAKSRQGQSEHVNKNAILDILKRDKIFSFVWNIESNKALTTETILSEKVDIQYGVANAYSDENARISSEYCNSENLDKLKKNKETVFKAEQEGEKNYELYSLEYIVKWKDFYKITVDKELIILENKDKGYKETFKAILNMQKSEIIELQNIKSKKTYKLFEYPGSMKGVAN
jgi:hypothetical protein